MRDCVCACVCGGGWVGGFSECVGGKVCVCVRAGGGGGGVTLRSGKRDRQRASKVKVMQVTTSKTNKCFVPQAETRTQIRAENQGTCSIKPCFIEIGGRLIVVSAPIGPDKLM